MELVWNSPRILVDGAHNRNHLRAHALRRGPHPLRLHGLHLRLLPGQGRHRRRLDRVNLGADKVIFTRAQGNPRVAAPADLQRAFAERSGKMSQIADTLPEALELASRAVSREDLICVTGSFYLVGETMKHLAKRQQPLVS